MRPANNGLLTILREDSAGIYVYRLQELLWFTETNRNWGLGIVENRQVRTGGTQQQSNAYYQIQPLGSPFAVKPPVLIPHGPQLRPYLSWTPPTFTGGPLDCHAQDFLAVDWFRREQEHEDSANVDAAIFMAKNIDGSYSVQHSPTTPSVIERLFFGPECIWRDDYVTLKTHEGILVQVIQRIIPAQPRPPSQTPSSSPPPLFLLQGFTLTLNTDPSFFPDKTWSPARHPRLQKELAFFHSHLPPSSSPAKWTLVEPRSQYGIADVKGRWYGMHEIGHLLGPELLARLESDRALGRVTHASRALNDRGVDSLRPALDGLGRFFPTRRAVSAEAFVAPVGGPAGRHPYSAQALAGNGAALMVSESNLRVYKAE